MVAAAPAQCIGCTNSRATVTQTATPTALGVALRGCAIVPRPHAACGGPQPPFSSFVPQPGDSSDCERVRRATDFGGRYVLAIRDNFNLRGRNKPHETARMRQRAGAWIALWTW